MQLSGTLATALTVNLSSDDTTEITVPATVTVPAGALSANFTAAIVNDTLADGAQPVSITATAAGFPDGTVAVSVLDNDANHFVLGAVPVSQVPGVPFAITVSARDLNDAPIPNFNSSVALTAAGTGGPFAASPATLTGWVNGVWSGNASVSGAGTNVVLTADDGQGHTGASNAFNLTVGPLDHFAWAPVASPQTRDNFFPVTLTAQDVGNNTVASFNGTAALKAVPQVASQADIGTGTVAFNYPMRTYYHDSRTQVIYPAGDLGGARRITALALDVTTVPGQTMNAWTIRMKHTPLTSYAAGAQWESTGWTTVYQANQTVSTTGWVTFTFSTPFNYDGASSLLVDFSHNNTSYTSDGSVRATTASAVRTASFATDSGSGDPLTWAGTTPAPSTSTSVPNLRLSYDATTSPVSIIPLASGSFVGGVWSGNVAVPFAGAGVKLRADDGASHTGDSNAFTVQAPAVSPGTSGTILSEPFESATLGAWWTITGTNNFRTQLTTLNTPRGGTKHLTMDSSVDANYARNEATLTVNLAGRTGVSLSFWAKEFSDEPNGPPAIPFVGGADFDGVAISADGTNWYEVQALRTLTSTYAQFTVNLDAAIAARGLSYNSAFKIRFNQYDDYGITTDGIAIDDILITATALPAVTIATPAQANENAGALTGTVTFPTTAGADRTVTLASNANAKVAVPANVTVLAGQLSADFTLTVLDNALLDGNRDVAITATSGSGTGSATIRIIDNEVTTLALTLPVSTTEGATGITGTATLGAVPSGAITFNVTSSDTTEITVPATVTSTPGQSTISIPLTVVNDTVIDGPQNATVTLSATGWVSASRAITVLDNETMNLALSFATTVNEGGTTSGTVSLSGTYATSVVVTLASNNPAQLTVPASVTIAAGTLSASFTLTGVEDTLTDGTQAATVTASATSFTSATRNISVLDNDVHHLVFAALTGPKFAGVPFSVTVTAQDVNNVTVTPFAGTVGLTAAGDGGAVQLGSATSGTFVSGVWTGNVTCLTARTNVRLTATLGAATGVSGSFEVLVPAAIVLSPANVSLTLNQGETAIRTVAIGNPGGSPLTWSIAAPAVQADVVKAGPVFDGHEPVGKSEPLWHDPASVHVESRDDEPVIESAAAPALAAALANLNLNNGLVRAAIPTRYAFTEGVTGTNISDGGNDMYDGGNYLGTNLGTGISYSDNVVAASALLGAGGQYFTRKYDGLWVFAADVNGLSYFEITGNLGADSSGATDSAVLSVVRDGVTYRGFVKRVYNAGDPSVNHLIIAADNGSMTHAVSTDTNDDYHRLTSLTGVTRIYHVLYAGTGGAYIDNTATLAIMTAFLDAVSTPDFVTPNATSGTVAAGGSQDLVLTISAANLGQGNYSRTLLINTNDPARPQVSLPVALTVSSAANLSVTPATGWTPGGWRGGPFTPATQAFTLTNTGNLPLGWTAAKTAAWLDLSATSGTLNPGATATVTATLNAGANALAPGAFSDTLAFTNTTSGLGNTTRPVTLTVTAFGELAVTPALPLDATGPFGGPFTPASQAYTLSNPGDAALNWTAGKTAPWLTLSSASGTLAAGASTTVTATIAATTTNPGSYADTLAFTNTTNGRGNTTRTASLAVVLPAPLLVPEPPATGGTTNALAWNAVFGAGEYEVQTAADAAFTSPVSSGWLAGMTHTFTGLNDGTQYHYRARDRRAIPGVTGSWTQTSQTDFAANTASNVSTSASPGAVVLAAAGTLTENFDAPGTAWSSTIFPNVSTGTFERTSLAGTGPNTTPPLPVNQAGDLEARLTGTRPSALMTDAVQNRFADGSIEAYIAPAHQSALHYAGLLLRASRSGGVLNGYGAILLFYGDGTVKADFSRIISGSDNGTSNWFYSNTTSFALGVSENIRARFSIAGNTLTLRLWRVSVIGGVVSETPIPFYQGGNTLTATDTTYAGAGLAGIYDSYSNVNQSLFDDVSVTGVANSSVSAGTLTTPPISPTPLGSWGALTFTKDTTAAGTALTVDVLNASGTLLAANVASGADLSAIPAVASQPSLRLRANLSTTNSVNTPRLDDWSVSWQATPQTFAESAWSAVVSSRQDATKPAITVTTPQIMTLASLPLAGIAGDLSGIASLTVNGTAAVTGDSFLHWSTAPLKLAPGWNTFQLAASDNAVPPNLLTRTHTLYFATDGGDADRDGLPDSWEAAHGLDMFKATGVSGALGDSDKDGLPNLLERAFGLNPRAADAAGTPVVTTELNPADQQQYLVVRYRRLLAPGTLTYIVEVSRDCATWSSAGADSEEIAPPQPTGDGITETVSLRIKPSIGDPAHSCGFVRVRVVVP